MFLILNSTWTLYTTFLQYTCFNVLTRKLIQSSDKIVSVNPNITREINCNNRSLTYMYNVLHLNRQQQLNNLSLQINYTHDNLENVQNSCKHCSFYLLYCHRSNFCVHKTETNLTLLNILWCELECKLPSLCYIQCTCTN